MTVADSVTFCGFHFFLIVSMIVRKSTHCRHCLQVMLGFRNDFYKLGVLLTAHNCRQRFFLTGKSCEDLPFGTMIHDRVSFMLLKHMQFQLSWRCFLTYNCIYKILSLKNQNSHHRPMDSPCLKPLTCKAVWDLPVGPGLFQMPG